ncbi:MAG: response regulator [bacterium]|nr:response regulator [bacterium]
MTDDSNKGQFEPLVLVVDDVQENHKVLGNILRKDGCRIAPATSGKQALDMLSEISPDLVLLDIVMPEMDGFEVCRKIMEMPGTENLPVIFLTAKTENEDVVEGFTVGAVDYVTKPFNSAELLARVRTHLKLKRLLDSEKKLIENLENALANVKQLTGLLPICAGCKKVRDDRGYWQQVEEYFMDHSEVHFTHSLCPHCVTKYSRDED